MYFSHEDNNSAPKQQIAMPIGTKLVNPNDPHVVYQITGVLGQKTYGIVYSARKCFLGNENVDIGSLDYVEVRIHEHFRGEDGVVSCVDGRVHAIFYHNVCKHTKLSFRQVLQLFQEGDDPDFFQANGTRYFVQHENGNTRLRAGSVFTQEGTQYQAEAVCGKGSYGRVWRLKRIHQSLQKRCTSLFSADWTKNRYVAIKQFCFEPVHSLHSTLRLPEYALHSFRQGFVAHACLNHPNVAKVYGFFNIKGIPSFIMEYIEGSNLREYVDRNGCMSEVEARGIIITICKALKYCHEQGVCHGDLKPNNVMITSDGTIKLIDFGGTTYCSDIVGMARVYFYLLSGVTLSPLNHSHPTQEAMEQIATILCEKKVSDVVKSQIFYMLEGCPVNYKALDLFYNQSRTILPCPYCLTTISIVYPTFLGRKVLYGVIHLATNSDQTSFRINSTNSNKKDSME